MVNIGGRSKGCSTCRKRRVKCDENRPRCRRCQSLNLQCYGPKGISFIYDKLAGPIKTQTRTASSVEAPVLLSATPRIVGFDVYICYTQAQLIRDGLIESSIKNIRAADLVPSGTVVASRRVSHQAIMSFATMHFGIQHRQADITRQGYAMYGVALKQLNWALSNTTRHNQDELIVAVAALSVSELLMPSGPDNYLTHMMGLERLINLEDPVSFWSKKPLGFRKGVRFIILLASVKLCRPSILAKLNWKKAMRANLSYEELQEQDLFDILADCSILLADRGAMLLALNANLINAREQRADIEQRASSLLIHLYDWRRRWDATLENTFSGTAISPSGLEESRFIHNEGPETPLATATSIPNVPVAVMLMLYNLVLMHVLQIITTLPFEESATGIISQQLETANTWCANERIAARETCRCIQYYLHIRRRLDTRASPIVHWAVATAWTALRRDDLIEGAWMRDLLCKKRRQVIAGGIWTTYLWLNSLPEG